MLRTELESINDGSHCYWGTWTIYINLTITLSPYLYLYIFIFVSLY